jgi:hypothetical protein
VLGLSVGTALHAQSLAIRSARSVGGTTPALQLALTIELGPRATEALQAGLLLAFDVDWQLEDGRQLQRAMALRYSPLLRSYQLAIGNEPPQAFTVRNGLLAAMENARLRWPDQAACAGDCGGRVRARLNPAALPAPLRLPALFDSDWDFDSGWNHTARGAGGWGLGTSPGAPSDRVAGWRALKSGARGRGQGEQPTARSDHAASLAPCPLPPAPLLLLGGGQQLLGTSP